MAHFFGWTNQDLNSFELASLYEWLDRLPLSRTRTNVEKDFADGCLVGEIVKHYFPTYVDMRDYQTLQNIQERVAQWTKLNTKVLSRMGFVVNDHMAKQLSMCKTGVAQVLLSNLRACLTLMGASTYSTVPMYNPKIRRSYPMLAGPVDANITPRKSNNNMKLVPMPMIPASDNPYLFNRVLMPPKNNTTGKVPPQPLKRNAYSNPNLKTYNNDVGFLPPINNGSMTRRSDSGGGDPEKQHLRSQIKRMEILLQHKNSKIYELQEQLNYVSPSKKPPFKP